MVALHVAFFEKISMYHFRLEVLFLVSFSLALILVKYLACSDFTAPIIMSEASHDNIGT